MKKRPPLSPRQLLSACIILVGFASITLFLFRLHRDQRLFTRITSQLFREEMTASTLNMHYTLAYPENFGIRDYEAVLPVYCAEGRLSSQAATENALAALEALQENKLSKQDAYTCCLLKRSLQNSLEKSKYPYYEEPLSPSSGMQSQLPILLAEYTFRNRQDVDDYLKLLDQVDEYFNSLLLFEQEKAKAGLLLPASSLEKVKEQCDTIVTLEALNSGEHFLQTTFAERLQELVAKGELAEEELPGLLAQNDRLLRTVVRPAYEALADGLFVLEDNSIPLSGLAARPQGREYYECLLLSETGSYRSIPEIQELLFNSFRQEYQAIRALADTRPALVQELADEENLSFPYEEPAEMLADLQNRMIESFPSLPEVTSSAASPTVTVKNVSQSLEQYCAPAFYLTAPIDDTDNNVIYINQKHSPEGLALYTTLAHEGYPGHLYQTVYSNRSFLEHKENHARELLWYGGYLEGWALYVEFQSYDYASQLLTEQGQETSALAAKLEKHSRSLQLCLYSLLDIMIHYKGASYSQVADVLEKFGISDPASCRAVYTYIVEEPCNYLKYYLGYLEILQLQKQARELWGSSYSDLAFHTFYLDCGPSDFASLRERLAVSRSSSMLSR